MSNREKLAVRLESELRERLERCYTIDGSRSRREYIENAIRFYTDYQEMQGAQSLLPKEIATALDGRLGMLVPTSSAPAASPLPGPGTTCATSALASMCRS